MTRNISCHKHLVRRVLHVQTVQLRDRVCLHVEVPAQRPDALQGADGGETSVVLRERVCAARARMHARQGRANALLEPRGIRQHVRASPEAMRLLAQAMDELGLSARAHDRILKVARTIADLDGRDDVGLDDVSEAIGYRVLDRPA